LAESKITATIFAPEPPYAGAWRKFDRIEQWAKSIWTYEFVMIAVVMITGVMDGIDPKLRHPMMMVEIASGVVLALIAQYARLRLKHWRCPRCRAEWPGKKLEKERRCATCRLELHQMSP